MALFVTALFLLVSTMLVNIWQVIQNCPSFMLLFVIKEFLYVWPDQLREE
jgi:hypothetical protein